MAMEQKSKPTKASPLSRLFLKAPTKRIYRLATADEWIYTYNGFDTIRAAGGADRAYGGYGNDTIYGGAGNDQLYGEQDDDILRGGAGDDELYGAMAMTTSKAVMAMTA